MSCSTDSNVSVILEISTNRSGYPDPADSVENWATFMRITTAMVEMASSILNYLLNVCKTARIQKLDFTGIKLATLVCQLSGAYLKTGPC